MVVIVTSKLGYFTYLGDEINLLILGRNPPTPLLSGGSAPRSLLLLGVRFSSIMHCASSQKQKHTKTVPHLVPKHTTHENTGNDCLYCCQAMSKHGCLIFFVPFHGKLRTVRLETDAKAYLKTFSAHHF